MSRRRELEAMLEDVKKHPRKYAPGAEAYFVQQLELCPPDPQPLTGLRGRIVEAISRMDPDDRSRLMRGLQQGPAQDRL